MKDVLLLDVTPLSLGIETRGGVMTKLIERNTTIPTRKSEVFTTAEDMQPSVEIHVLQGEREMAKLQQDARQVPACATCRRRPVASRRSRSPSISMPTASCQCRAKDRATGKEQSITISGQSTLSKDDIAKMVKDAEAHAEEDKQSPRRGRDPQQRRLARVPDRKGPARAGRQGLRRREGRRRDAACRPKSALSGNDQDAIKSATEKLMAASQTFSSKLYEAAARDSSAAGSSASGQSGSGSDDDIVDAEIVDDK